MELVRWDQVEGVNRFQSRINELFEDTFGRTRAQELSLEQKIEILRRWEQDATLMEVAEEEGMPGPQPKLLQPIRDALHALNYWPDTEHSSPSKV